MSFLCYIKKCIKHKYLKPMERRCNLVVKGMCIGVRVKLNPGFITCHGCNL